MKKRLIALLLAFVMVLGLTATVFAEGGISIASIQPEAPTHTYISVSYTHLTLPTSDLV